MVVVVCYGGCCGVVVVVAVVVLVCYGGCCGVVVVVAVVVLWWLLGWSLR